jgi:Leucine-rich repeat (LRR) protein/GTPase SAR1 family protein
MAETPRWAQEKIDRARAEGLKELDLSRERLTDLYGNIIHPVVPLFQIPDQVFELEQLETLKLGNNYIWVIPEHLSRLQNLTTLDLSFNGLSEIPEHLSRLQNLTTLDLSFNGLSEIPEHLSRLQNLTTLYLNRNGLSAIPEHLSRLQNLTTLDLSFNGLSEIPEHLSRLQNLTSLYLRSNQLSAIPEHLSRLQNLTTLYLRSNQLSAIPEHLSRLQNLTTLYLSDNQLSEIPEHLSRLQNLTTLDLRSNQLSEIPEHLSRLQNLTSLYLRSNQLSEIPEHLSRLQNLTSLDLRSNQLSEIPEHLSRLQNLTTLDLRSNQLSEIPEHLSRLQNLTTLDLSYNQLSEIPEHLSRLQNLTTLYLSDNQLSEIPEHLSRLQNLTTLDLSFNGLSEIPEHLSRLQNLTSLYLRSNQLSEIPEHLSRLQNLTTLYLNRNGLSAIPEHLSRLQNLTTLDLSFNGLSEIPEHLSRLQNLTTLDLSYNQLSEIPEHLSRLQNLTTLYLSDNKLSEIPEHLSRLQNLTTLDLSYNKLSEIPEHLSRLQNLTTLDLSYNKLSEIPEHLSRLQNLTTLYLRYNKLSEIPEHLSRLQNLTTLYLRYNQLSEIPEHLSRLQNLTTLDLSYNKLSEIPEHLSRLQNLTRLDIDGNPIETPPPEVVSNGIAAIRDYYRQLREEGVDYIYEAKLLIVGEPGAGKTSLAKKIDDETYQLQSDEKSTEGIEVIKWPFTMPSGQDFMVNIWDFGGQEIYKTTHQFFLTKRSLYILVADTRKEDTDFYYWLNIVELLSNNSPLLIVKNEKQNRKREIGERQLKGQFECYKDTLATNLEDNRGLDDIVDKVQHYVQHLPHIGDALPKTWVNVREALEQDERNYISIDTFFDICKNHGFKQSKDMLQLSDYLHDLGICLHFIDDPLLKKTVILSPKWGTDAVYRVLDNENAIANNGCFSLSDLDDIWHEEEYAMMRDELLRLMIKFKLCYEIPGLKDIYIAPQLLSEEQPKYKWSKAQNLILKYSYPEFMPKGIITQFIVATHKFIFDQKYVWRDGVILAKDDANAEVIEYYGKREIEIKVVGNNRRDLLTIIRYELSKIHDTFNRLNFDELIPCNCSECRNSEAPYMHKYQTLIRAKSKGRSEIECQKSFEDVNVLSLIDDVGGIIEKVREGQPPNQYVQNNFFSGVERMELAQISRKAEANQFHFGKGDIVAGGKYLNQPLPTPEHESDDEQEIEQVHFGQGDNVAEHKYE